jgi:hypothetical protein
VLAWPLEVGYDDLKGQPLHIKLLVVKERWKLTQTCCGEMEFVGCHDSLYLLEVFTIK